MRIPDSLNFGVERKEIVFWSERYGGEAMVSFVFNYRHEPAGDNHEKAVLHKIRLWQAMMDGWALGGYWSKQPDNRSRFILAIENGDTDKIHAHAIFKRAIKKSGVQKSWVDTIGKAEEIWKKVVPSGSIDFKIIDQADSNDGEVFLRNYPFKHLDLKDYRDQHEILLSPSLKPAERASCGTDDAAGSMLALWVDCQNRR
jgi:hypothetical protein